MEHTEMFPYNVKLSKEVLSVKKWLTLITLLLLAIPALCFASEGDVDEVGYSKPQSSFYSAYAKSLAESYVLDLKEKYADKITDPNYVLARHKYRIAESKFSGLKSTLELDIIGGKYVPNINDPKYEAARNEALIAFYEFDSHARKALGLPTSDNSNKNKETIELGISVLEKLYELWVKNNTIREERLSKLKTWVFDYYHWSKWEDITSSKSKAE